MAILGPNGQEMDPAAMNSATMETLPPNAFSGATDADIAAMPAEAMEGMDADMMAAMPANTMEVMTDAQTANIPAGEVVAAEQAVPAGADPAGGNIADPTITAAETAANDDPMAGLADFAAANPTGGEAPVVDAPIATDAPAQTEAAPSLDDALGAAMDAGETGGASVADAAVPDAGVPADAGIADAPEAAEPAEPTAAPEPDIV